MTEQLNDHKPVSQNVHSLERRGRARADAPQRFEVTFFLLGLLEIVWLLIAMLLPLWVNLWARRPFEPPKALLLQLLVSFLVAIALAEHILSQRSLRADLGRARQVGLLLWPVVVFLAALIASTLLAADWRLSLWGSYERRQGFVTLVCYILLFTVVALRLRSKAQGWRLIMAMVATSGPLLLLGLAQQLGWNPLAFNTDARSAVYGTLGRANFLGAYLSILMPLTLALRLMVRQRSLRLLLSGLLLGQIGVIALTLSRGAWLASAVSLGAFALLWWGRHLRRRWRRALWVCLGLLFSAGPAVTLWLGGAQQGSAAARLAIWRAATRLLRQRPWLGYGPDGLELVFPGVYPPELVYYQGRDFLVDRAHNLFFDVGLTTGLLGLGAYLAVLIGFVLLGLSRLRQSRSGQERLLYIAALAAVLGNGANNLVSFDVTATATAIWLLMALTAALSMPAVPEPAFAGPASTRRRWLAGGVAVGLAVGTIYITGHLSLAEVYARMADDYRQGLDGEQAVWAGEQATGYWSIEPIYYINLSTLYWQQALANPHEGQAKLQQAESALLTARDLRPNDYRSWVALGEFYAAANKHFNREMLPLAHQAYGQALTLAPNQATVYAAWGRLYLSEGNPQRAAELLRQAILLDASDAVAYTYLGEAELALGRTEVAIADFREAVRLKANYSPAYASLANGLWLAGRGREARQALAIALRLDPTNPAALMLQQQIGSNP